MTAARQFAEKDKFGVTTYIRGSFGLSAQRAHEIVGRLKVELQPLRKVPKEPTIQHLDPVKNLSFS